MTEIKDQIKNLVVQRKERLWEIWLSVGAVGLLILPIILNVRLYADDIDRASGGSLNWDTDGRIIANWLYRIAHLGSARAVFDHPLGAIVCIPLILLGGLFASLLFQRKSLAWVGVLSILLFGQPYFLENLSYGFDSPLMVISIVMCIAAAWLCVSAKQQYLFIVAGSLVSISLLIYQPANNAFWIPICLLGIYSWRTKTDNRSNKNQISYEPKRFIVNSILVQTLALLIYKFAFSPFFKLTDYASNVQSLPKPSELPLAFFTNINDFCDTLLRNGFESALGLSIVIYIAVSIILISSDSNFWLGITKIILFVAVLALSQGLMLTLGYRGFEARTYIGVGVFLVSLAPMTWSVLEGQWKNPAIKKWTRRFYIGILAAIVWGLISCSYAYGSVFRSQDDLNHYYRQTIANEVLQSESLLEKKFIGMSIIGYSPDSPIAKNTFKVYPFMSDMIDRVAGHSNGIRRFRQYGLRLNQVKESNLKSYGVQLDADANIIDRPDFSISQQNSVVVIRFKKK